MKTYSGDYFAPPNAGLVWTIIGGTALYLLGRYRYFVAAFAVVAVLSVSFFAEAGSNIKQKDTGATVWENQDGEQVPVGNPGLTVLLEDVSTASTAWVVSHKSGDIIKIYSTSFGEITTADAVLDFGIALSPGNLYQSISSAGTNNPQGGIITITKTAAVTGSVFSVTFTPGTDIPTGVTAGQAIWVHTDGGSTIDIDAVITIIIE